VLRSSFLEIGAALALSVAQGATDRVEYQLRVVRAAAAPAGRQIAATGLVTGPAGTGLRLSLHSDSAEVEALFGVEPGGESDFVLVGEFFTKRRLGQSRRGLPLWEQDGYRRAASLRWGDTARVYPLGPPRRGAAESLWVELSVVRRSAGGLTRPGESTTILAADVGLTLEAVVRPHRAVVWLTLVRGDTASPPRRLDLVVEAPGRVVDLPVGLRDRRRLEVALARPDPPRSDRDRALARDADVVCLRVGEPGASGPLRALCARLNNVVRRLSLGDGDTLVATLAWPGDR
jgi:hypothetical protein